MIKKYSNKDIEELMKKILDEFNDLTGKINEYIELVHSNEEKIRSLNFVIENISEISQRINGDIMSIYAKKMKGKNNNE